MLPWGWRVRSCKQRRRGGWGPCVMPLRAPFGPRARDLLRTLIEEDRGQAETQHQAAKRVVREDIDHANLQPQSQHQGPMQPAAWSKSRPNSLWALESPGFNATACLKCTNPSLYRPSWRSKSPKFVCASAKFALQRTAVRK